MAELEFTLRWRDCQWERKSGPIRFRLNRILTPLIPLSNSSLYWGANVHLFERGRGCWEGASPPLSVTPLYSQEYFSFFYSGPGWRGVRGEVNNYQLNANRVICGCVFLLLIHFTIQYPPFKQAKTHIWILELLKLGEGKFNRNRTALSWFFFNTGVK